MSGSCCAAGPGGCLVCIQPLPESTRRLRKFCTAWCGRAQVLRRHGLLSAPHNSARPVPAMP
ncbi:hypothetical protein [Streptomyces liliifuscus]|uniref:Uncharacterized protein n=1 Tax=Streptomyces liliifuscus TaxID=2797636 RepID=A0A7T7RH07_9ACTN|nr:hypothetical protein [Streptomyces liliifuscus]QQM38049.1 hypothetical protein JEQ17_00015 [Streptomyces liliifuscus]QQM46393.1 hypothetical protein JEQ17_48040 [Streptomyces liliifuscus]